ncbi:NTP transferase domain-containing protein [Ornithinimicrobium sp. LYQ103]|uniref:phosphocholine cytidylyltransferase family protein n=1 Tax=Ornithinimicrobium sp. LYQ103 TaxID=3378796 RepID=UPI003853FC12
MDDLVAVVLAAGSGMRLMPHTADRPKATIPFIGATPLSLLTSSLRAVGVEDIVVVRGTNGASVGGRGLRVIESGGTGNMVSSLMSAVPHLPAGRTVLVCYGDLILQRSLLRTMVQSDQQRDDVWVAVDADWEAYFRWRFFGGIGDAESCVVDSRGCIVEIGGEVPPGSSPSHQFIGLVRFSPHGLRRAVDLWNRAAHPQMQTTQLLQCLIDEGSTVRAREVRGGWLEIDSPSDLAGAINVCEGGVAVPFFDPTDIR